MGTFIMSILYPPVEKKKARRKINCVNLLNTQCLVDVYAYSITPFPRGLDDGPCMMKNAFPPYLIGTGPLSFRKGMKKIQPSLGSRFTTLKAVLGLDSFTTSCIATFLGCKRPAQPISKNNCASKEISSEELRWLESVYGPSKDRAL